MAAMPIRWKVRPILDRHKLTPYRLMVTSGLSRAVVYGIANGTHPALDTGVVEKLMKAMRDLTGDEALQIGDVVEYVR